VNTYPIPSYISIPEEGPCHREKALNVLHIHETKLNYLCCVDSIKYQTASKFTQAPSEIIRDTELKTEGLLDMRLTCAHIPRNACKSGTGKE
jgi:hypothetical protein